MSDLAKETTPVNIREEFKSSYLDYTMSVIVGRTLPDIRDGLRPVHRHVLYVMNVLGNDWDRAYKKSACAVGDVTGKYRPHGDSAVYDTIVRTAQLLSLRYILVDGQGNFGSIGDGSVVTMRYTEIRLVKITHGLMADLEKEAVSFVGNCDGTEHVPDVMPAKIPNPLASGASGIAVGMATNIPPHDLTEMINGCLTYVDDEDISIGGLMAHIPGPDFPTAAIINGRCGTEETYHTDRGKVYIRACVEVEIDAKSGRKTIIVHEIPYQMNKARLIEKITELIKEKRVEGINALRDGSDKDGMRVVTEVKRDVIGEVVLSNLYSQTQLQVSFSINMAALHHDQPRIMNLKDAITAFAHHRRGVATCRTIFELRKARDRAHTLEALAAALANIDLTIELIRRASTLVKVKTALVVRAWDLGNAAAVLECADDNTVRPEWLEPEFGVRDDKHYLTKQQVQAILDLRLQKLTSLEHEKLLGEYKELLEQIVKLLHILDSADRLTEVTHEELELIRDQFDDECRAEITVNNTDINVKDLINQEDAVVALPHQGYVKYQPLTGYEAQCRGGKSKSAARIKEEDFVDRLLMTDTHDTILYFSNRGRLYWMRAYQLPEASRGARGHPIVNLLPLEADGRTTAILPVREYEEGVNVFMATASGTVKRTTLTEFGHPRSAGIIAVNLNEGDELIGVNLTLGQDEVILFSVAGKVVHFKEGVVCAMGRTAAGVRGIKLAEGDSVVSLTIPRGEGAILTITRNGYGKRIAAAEHPTRSRAIQGVISTKVAERNGSVVGAVQVDGYDQIMMITDAGTLVRTHVSEVSIMGCNTQGAILIRTMEDENAVGLQRVTEPVDNEELDAIDGSAAEDDDNIASEADTDDDTIGDEE